VISKRPQVLPLVSRIVPLLSVPGSA